MKHASEIFDDQTRQRINAAVAEAEAKTSAEIVPVVATASGRYDRAEDLAGLCFAILLMIAAWMIFQRVDPDLNGWRGPRLTINLAELVIILAGGFIAGALIASHFAPLRRLFTPRHEMDEEVNERARQVFFDQRMHHTKSRGGLLLYVSLFERMAVVIADDAVVEKLGKPAIDDLCNHLTTKLRSGGGDIADALPQTIAVAGEKLSQVLPREAGDVNELPDALVTVD